MIFGITVAILIGGSLIVMRYVSDEVGQANPLLSKRMIKVDRLAVRLVPILLLILGIAVGLHPRTVGLAREHLAARVGWDYTAPAQSDDAPAPNEEAETILDEKIQGVEWKDGKLHFTTLPSGWRWYVMDPKSVPVRGGKYLVKSQGVETIEVFIAKKEKSGQFLLSTAREIFPAEEGTEPESIPQLQPAGPLQEASPPSEADEERVGPK